MSILARWSDGSNNFGKDKQRSDQWFGHLEGNLLSKFVTHQIRLIKLPDEL